MMIKLRTEIEAASNARKEWIGCNGSGANWVVVDEFFPPTGGTDMMLVRYADGAERIVTRPR